MHHMHASTNVIVRKGVTTFKIPVMLSRVKRIHLVYFRLKDEKDET